VLVQANFSGTLTVLGVPIERDAALAGIPSGPEPDGNSCMIVVATDAALDARQLTRLARRAVFSMARTGSDYAHGSGDYAISFSTADGPSLTDAQLDPLFVAVMEGVEEAILNALFMAETTHGHHGHIRHAVPHEFVTEECAKRGIVVTVPAGNEGRR
jgi:D-aminopeptidase